MKQFITYCKKLLQVTKDAASGFLEHKVLKMSAALAYTTMFSLGPLLLVILFLSDIFFGRKAVEGSIFNQITAFVGPNAAAQIQSIIENLALSNDSVLAGIVGGITLLIGATSVFAEIQDSINTIWGIQPKKQSGIWLFFKARLLSFGVIGSFGFILLVSLVLSSFLDAISERLFLQFSDVAVNIVLIGNSLLTFLIISLLFGAIFTILPHAAIKWRQVRLAAFTTAILFMLGKFLISFYLAKSDIQNVYGAAGSFVILMLWVYYSSVILYFGAEFAKSYAVMFSSPIIPSSHADLIQTIETISKKRTLQEAAIEHKVLQKES